MPRTLVSINDWMGTYALWTEQHHAALGEFGDACARALEVETPYCHGREMTCRLRPAKGTECALVLARRGGS